MNSDPEAIEELADLIASRGWFRFISDVVSPRVRTIRDELMRNTFANTSDYHARQKQLSVIEALLTDLYASAGNELPKHIEEDFH